MRAAGIRAELSRMLRPISSDMDIDKIVAAKNPIRGILREVLLNRKVLKLEIDARILIEASRINGTSKSNGKVNPVIYT